MFAGTDEQVDIGCSILKKFIYNFILGPLKHQFLYRRPHR